MAKRRKAAPKRKAKTSRLEAAAARAAESLTPRGRVRQELRDLKIHRDIGPPGRPRPGLDTLLSLTRPPRQRSLRSERRVATVAALEGLKPGQALGERRRRAAQRRVPEELRRIICARRKARREAIFAKGGIGPGKRVRRPYQRRQGLLVPVDCD